MEVPYEKINVDKDGLVEVVNLKNIPEMIGGLRKNDGILPAYHMNKEYWITVLLDGTVEKQTIFNLIDISYDLTKNKKNKEKKTRSIICQIYI